MARGVSSILARLGLVLVLVAGGTAIWRGSSSSSSGGGLLFVEAAPSFDASSSSSATTHHRLAKAVRRFRIRRQLGRRLLQQQQQQKLSQLQQEHASEGQDEKHRRRRATFSRSLQNDGNDENNDNENEESDENNENNGNDENNESEENNDENNGNDENDENNGNDESDENENAVPAAAPTETATTAAPTATPTTPLTDDINAPLFDDAILTDDAAMNNATTMPLFDDALFGDDLLGTNDTTYEMPEPICNDDTGTLVLTQEDYLFRPDSNVECDYCLDYNATDLIAVPADLTDPVEIATFQALIAQSQLYNFSCRNVGCTTCFDHPRSSNNANGTTDLTTGVEVSSESSTSKELTTYCGYIESTEYIVVNPPDESDSGSSSNGDSNTNIAVGTNFSESFSDAFELLILDLLEGDTKVCLTYDDTADSTEAGKTVCLGAVVNTTATLDPLLNGTGNDCYIEYDGVRCNSCRDYILGDDTTLDYFVDTTCLIADCSNIDADLYALPMDSCSESNPFVGPLRFVETVLALELGTTMSRPGTCTGNANGSTTSTGVVVDTGGDGSSNSAGGESGGTVTSDGNRSSTTGSETGGSGDSGNSSGGGSGGIIPTAFLLPLSVLVTLGAVL